MIITIILILGLAFNAGVFNGTMDYIKAFNLDELSSKQKWFWVQDYSKVNKPLIKITYTKKWYYFGLFKPEFKEAFPFSSTILVFLTDDWHLKKWQMFLCYELALSCVIVYYESLPWWYILIGIILLKTVRGLGFTLKYDNK